MLGSACGPSTPERLVAAEPLYEADFTGLYLADAATGEELYARNADKLFTPASNVKILTLATALAWLPQDSLPALAYATEADTLRLWALAYPELAADSLPYNRAINNFIAAWPGTVEFNMHGYRTLPRFGAGWMWDDHPYAFARERSGLPLYRNLAYVWHDPDGGRDRLGGRPDFLAARRSSVLKGDQIQRDEASNRFFVGEALGAGDTLRAPLYAVANLATQLLEDWTGRPVRYHNRPLPSDWGARVLRGQPRDTLLRAMMLPSDNFLAEHLLLQAGLYRHGLTNESAVREQAQREVLALDEEALFWADGSGISHYNLVSPRSLAQVLRKLYADYPRELLLRLFPAGGESGTVQRFYGSATGEPPYVYAKTGTLRHTHCLSGYLRASSGRWLVFSFMHNHYAGTSTAYKRAMERTLAGIRDAY